MKLALIMIQGFYGFFDQAKENHGWLKVDDLA